MLSSFSRRHAFILAAVGSAMSCGSALAQYVWANPGTGGSWNLNTNWNPVGVPNSAVATASLAGLSPYTVSVDGSVTANLVTIAAPATVSLNSGLEFSVTGANAGLVNNGLFIVNGTGAANGTNFKLYGNDSTLTGTGSLVLNAHPSNLDTACVVWWSSGERLINGPTHNIRGTGRVRTYLTNNGVINADSSGEVLWLTDRDKINNGTMKASGGGQLLVNVRLDQDPAAVLRADAGSTVNIGGSVFGGSVGSAGSGVVQFNSTSGVASNTFFGNVNILNGVTVYIENANLVNNGTFTVNPSGGTSGTVLSLRSGPSTFSGTGTLRLNADASNLDTAQISWYSGGETVINAAGHSIRGTGRIRTYLTNNSTIAADVSGRTLYFSDRDKTNNSIIEATGGGTAYFTANLAQSPSAIIRCDGASSIVFQGCNVNGGTISAAAGAATQFIASASVSANPVITGATIIPAGNTMYFEATGMVNSGTLTVNPTAADSGTVLSLRGGHGTFTGNGTVTLNANAANLDTAQITWWSGNETLTQSPSHTIRGTGRIRLYLVNDGTISADRNGASIWISDYAKTNNSLMRATGGGNLTITSTLTQSSTGRIVAENASTVLISGCTVSGGQLQSSGTGVINTQASSHFGTITNAADLRLLPGSTLYIDGGSTFTDNRTLTIGDSGTAGGAYLSAFGGDVTLQGSGAVVLAGFGGDSDAAQITWWSGNEVYTNSAAHSIRGVGRVRAYLTNQGTISADVSTRSLWFSDKTKTNNNIIRAINGGNIVLTTAMVQGATGRLQVFDGSVMTVSSGSIDGGTLEGVGNGNYAIQASSYLQTFTNNSRINMLPGYTTYSSAGNTITNNGIMTVGNAASASAAYYVPQGGNVAISGNGTLILDSNPANLDLAQIAFWSGNEVLTNSPNHTIGGNGRIRVTLQNDGMITPGALGGGIGEIWKTDRPLNFGPNARLNIEIASATSYDKITGNVPIAIDGDLQIHLINGYTGGVGTTYEIVHGSSISGIFKLIDIPDHPTIGLKYGVQYTNTSVLLRVTCDVDFNSDGVIDLFDYLDFVDVFSSGVPDADFNADGVVDLFDYLDFLDQFARGCD